MDYDNFTILLASIPLSGREFAKLLKLNPNTIANYKRTGKVPSHLAVIAVLVQRLTESGISYVEQVEALNLEAKARRGKSIG